MKKRFCLEIMYGDADRYEEFNYITENLDEINFLTSFFKNWTKNLYHFYEAPHYFFENICDEERQKEIVLAINEMVKLFNKLGDEGLFLIDDEFDIGKMFKLLCDLLHFVDEYFGWDMYDWEEEYFGQPNKAKIEDVSDKICMTKKEAIKLLKEKLNLDVIFVD